MNIKVEMIDNGYLVLMKDPKIENNEADNHSLSHVFFSSPRPDQYLRYYAKTPNHVAAIVERLLTINAPKEMEDI